MIDQTVFGRVVFRFEGAEESLLGTKNLHRTGWMFCETEQTPRMADKPGTNELSHEGSQIRCNSVHSVTKVFC